MVKPWHYKIFDEFKENLNKSKELAYNPLSYSQYSADGVDVEYVLNKLSLKNENGIVSTTPDICMREEA